MGSSKVALVTGGGSGIGRATALRLGRDGLDVAVLDQDAAAAEQVAGEVGGLGRRAVALAADVASAAPSDLRSTWSTPGSGPSPCWSTSPAMASSHRSSR